MKKNLLTVALLALSWTVGAQVICSVNKDAVFYIGENALVYNGGGFQTVDNGSYDIHGNVMVVGTTTDNFFTLTKTSTDPAPVTYSTKTTGGNIIIRLNDPANFGTSSYGQLYINGLDQSKVTAIVDKEFRTPKHGTYQQIALPFYNKTISSFSGTASTIGTFGKNFTNVRYSKNEVLTWNNATAVSDNLSVNSTTPKSTSYYMLGSAGLNTSAPPATMATNAPTPTGSVYTLRGVPIANIDAAKSVNGISEVMQNAADGVQFGAGGNAVNYYNEKYNTYLQDDWDASLIPTNPWSAGTFGRNIYQFGNPYFTNIDLSLIGIDDGITIGDGNKISTIQGIRYDPGTVISDANGSTYSNASRFINFTTGVPGTAFGPVPVGDLGLIIRPMQTFVIKLRSNAAQTLRFDNLRRFKNTVRASGEDYSVTANRSMNQNATVKQLGIIGLDQNGQELARTYYAVYPTAITGHTSQSTVQSVLGSQNIIGTYEEDVNGGYDMNYINSYWLYINEANETDFLGKAVPLALYSTGIKSLKFEIRENTELIPDNTHNLSTGIGFYYKSPGGTISEIAQNQIIPVNSDEYSLYYGKAPIVLGTGGTAKPSRTKVVYKGSVDKFVVRFDPEWKKSDINVYDMSGKLIISQKDVSADKDFEINLAKLNTAYIVTAVSEKGEKVSSKIIR